MPTCPAWTTDALVAHQAMVHRWAAAHVRGDDPDVIPNQTEIRTTVDDLVGYYRDGHGALLATFHDAAPDLEAMTFLKDAPAPRDFWARRQAHETTIHMVDALAAVLGRLPTASEAGIAPASPSMGSTSCCAVSSPVGVPSCTTATSTRSRCARPTASAAGSSVSPNG